jgi:predicted dehydrogenase
VETVYAAYGDQVLAGSEDWDNWDAYSCTLRFAGGAVGSVATTYALEGPSSDGFGLDIVAEGMVLRWRSGGLTVEQGGEVETVPEGEDPTYPLHRAFYHALRTGDERDLRLTYPDALATLATVLACNQSHETGVPVRVADLLS